VPTGSAFFNTSNRTSLTFSTSTMIGGWTFNAGASFYTFTDSAQILIFNGTGIVIDGGSATVANNGGGINFDGTSTAGGASIENPLGVILFNDSSTAATSFINNSGTLDFNNSSTGGSATIHNLSGAFVTFANTSTAGGADITNESGATLTFNDTSSGGAAIIGNAGAITFNNSSSAGNAAITNNSTIDFENNSTAGSATITNDIHGLIEFSGTSTAGNATVTNNSGILFIVNSTGGNAAIVNNAAGYGLDFSASSGLAGNHQLSVGSIAGAGTVYLGANQLTIGSNNLTTDVSGVISDCGPSGTACASPTAGGSLVKVGAGTLTLSGDNIYTGSTTVDAGTLEVDGSIVTSSLTTVNNSGTLAGTGTVSATQINAGGTFAPGSGTPGSSLTVAGNLAFQSGALYVIYLNPTTSSFATVNGAASLAGMVNANFAAGSYAAKQYTILKTTGGLGGTTFSGLTIAGLPNFDASLSYSADDVFLNLTAGLGAGTSLNQNQQNVANAINAYFNNVGTLPTQFSNLFNLTGAPLANALTQLDGEDATGTQTGAFTLMNEFLELMAGNAGGVGAGGNGGLGFAPDQQTELPPDIALAYDSILKAPPKRSFDNRWSVWGSGFGGSSSFEGNAAVGSNNVTTTTYGSAAGMEYRPDPNTRLGFALAGAGLNWGLAQGLGTGRSDAFLAGVYGKRYFGPAYISGALAFGNNWFTTNRTALGDQLTASFTGQSYAIRGEAGYRYAEPMRSAVIGITPYVALQTQWFRTPAYSETDLTGGGFGLSYNANTANDTRSELGARFDDFTTWSNKPLVLRASLAWAHDWTSGSGLNAAFQALPGSAFTVNGSAVPPDSALTTASAQYYFTPDLSFIAKFDGEFAPTAQTYAGSGTLKYTF
jgi:autotransporter-associated beta strand protein